MSCEVTREPTRPYGWECDGENLLKILTGPRGLPVVAPMSRMWEVMRPEWASTYVVERFDGGDHYHVVIE